MIVDDLETILNRIKSIQQHPDLYNEEIRERAVEIGEKAVDALGDEYPSDEDILSALGVPRQRGKGRYVNSLELAWQILESEDDSQG